MLSFTTKEVFIGAFIAACTGNPLTAVVLFGLGLVMEHVDCKKEEKEDPFRVQDLTQDKDK
jgi:hypothetical protein